ncbi:hypothetical protein [Roseicyclus persicicus]|uniref:Dihydrodipicolinate reductase n=1 Tax=Roseicyclus persicicus TaxID=2650661 RepID=A0A7X6H1S0_9RHOB|nr:hypothetical protein [Roseibacterium persicicum]NKX46428.1 hypothetical protein [Roseibacterium persicicum]
MTLTRRSTRALAVVAALAPAPALADWRVVHRDEAVALLTTHDIAYDDIAWERHEADGRLLARVAEGARATTSVGEWRFVGDARCLRWSGADRWECYRVEADDAGGVRFIDGYRNVSTGALVARAAP